MWETVFKLILYAYHDKTVRSYSELFPWLFALVRYDQQNNVATDSIFFALDCRRNIW